MQKVLHHISVKSLQKLNTITAVLGFLPSELSCLDAKYLSKHIITSRNFTCNVTLVETVEIYSNPRGPFYFYLSIFHLQFLQGMSMRALMHSDGLWTSFSWHLSVLFLAKVAGTIGPLWILFASLYVTYNKKKCFWKLLWQMSAHSGHFSADLCIWVPQL